LEIVAKKWEGGRASFLSGERVRAFYHISCLLGFPDPTIDALTLKKPQPINA